MTVKAIEQAIEQLPPDQLTELATWFAAYHAHEWDRQIEDDLDSGRLDKILKEVEDEYNAGLAQSLMVITEQP